MDVKTEERKIIVRTFEFDPNEADALDMTYKICDHIRLGLAFEDLGEMISNHTGEVLTREDLDTTERVLRALIQNDGYSWDLK
jgi:hypothetical protein